jgi:hypothetical protein
MLFVLFLVDFFCRLALFAYPNGNSGFFYAGYNEVLGPARVRQIKMQNVSSGCTFRDDPSGRFCYLTCVFILFVCLSFFRYFLSISILYGKRFI